MHKKIPAASLFMRYWIEIFTTSAFIGWSRPSVWGEAVKQGGAEKVFTCLNTKVCLRQSLGVTQKWLPIVGQKVAIFVGPTMRCFREKQQLNALYIINSEKVWNGSQTVGLVFHKLRRSRISTKCIQKVLKHAARKRLPLFWLSVAKSAKNSVWNAFRPG